MWLTLLEVERQWCKKLMKISALIVSILLWDLASWWIAAWCFKCWGKKEGDTKRGTESNPPGGGRGSKWPQALANRRRRTEVGERKILGTDFVVKCKRTLLWEWMFLRKQKGDVFMWLPNQPANLWDHESGSWGGWRNTDSGLDGRTVDNTKNERQASPRHLKKTWLTVFCQVWCLGENLGMDQKCQRLM